MTLQDASEAAQGVLKYGPTGFAVIVLAFLAWSIHSNSLTIAALQIGFDTRATEIAHEIAGIEQTILDVTQRAAEAEKILAERRLELFVGIMRDFPQCQNAGGVSGGAPTAPLGEGAENPAPTP